MTSRYETWTTPTSPPGARLKPAELSSDAVLISYAQNAEDIRLARVFRERGLGFYVDVGAGDPTDDSVSRLFYDRGWSGINIEPGPRIDRLQEERPRDINLALAVAAEEESREFWISSPDPGLSTFDPPTNHELLPPDTSFERRLVPCVPLSRILEEYAPDRTIDFIKIDVEGAEKDVLQSIDLNSKRPTILIVEAVAQLTFEPSHSAWEPLVLGADFVLAAFDGINRFYVPHERSDLVDVLAYPISPLDNYVSKRVLDLHLALGDAPSSGERDAGRSAYLSLRDLANLDTRRQELRRPAEPPIVVVDAASAPDDLVRDTLDSLARNTDPGTYAVASLDPQTNALLLGNDQLGSASHRVWTDERAGAATMWQAILDVDADVVVVEAGVSLPESWLVRLEAVAYGDSMCATASAVRAPPSKPVPHEATRLWPFSPPLQAPVRGAVYVRKDALNLVASELRRNDVDRTGLEVLLEQALATPGLVHRLASNVVVRHPAASLSLPLEVEDVTRLNAPARRHATAKLPAGVHVMVDGRCLDQPLSGTQVHVLNLLEGVADTGAVDLSVLLPRELHESVEPYLGAITSVAGLYGPDRLPATRPAVFHRPYQFSTVEEVEAARAIGQRLVLTHQDMILDRTPSYYDSTVDWDRHRATTAAAFAAADQVSFFSRHAAWDAATDGLLAAERINVVPLGVDHPLEKVARHADAPIRVELAEEPFLLVVGGAYRHKNRIFALKAFDHLVSALAWDGMLVLAGAHPSRGSSVAEERAFLESRKATRDRTLDLGRVSDAEKRRLYSEARLVLFPSLYEGFGLVPFEAAACGTPSVYGWRSSLPEYLPRAGALFEGWDARRAAEAMLEVLEDERRANELVSAILDVGSHLTWAATAAGYLEVYRRALATPQGTHAGAPELRLAMGGRSTELTAGESRLLDVYRRRQSFRRALDGVVGAGRLALGASRRARGWRR